MSLPLETPNWLMVQYATCMFKAVIACFTPAARKVCHPLECLDDRLLAAPTLFFIIEVWRCSAMAPLTGWGSPVALPQS